MHMSLKGIVVGALAITGATLAAVPDAQAMPVQPLGAAALAAPLEHVYYYGYGYRRPFVRRFVRPFYGYRRFGYGYGYRRPFLGYRRPFGGYGFGYGYRRF